MLHYFGHLMQRTNPLEKTDAGDDWRQEEKGITEDKMVGWHHQLDGHEFEQAPGVGYGQGSLACCSPWGHKESDMTERLNWTELMLILATENNVHSRFPSKVCWNQLIQDHKKLIMHIFLTPQSVTSQWWVGNNHGIVVPWKLAITTHQGYVCFCCCCFQKSSVKPIHHCFPLSLERRNQLFAQ